MQPFRQTRHSQYSGVHRLQRDPPAASDGLSICFGQRWKLLLFLSGLHLPRTNSSKARFSEIATSVKL